jgi:hypothetical protein
MEKCKELVQKLDEKNLTQKENLENLGVEVKIILK